MRTDYFTLTLKKRATRATRATDAEKASNDAALQGEEAVAQTKSQWATRATADRATVDTVAHVAQTKNHWATDSEPQEASNDAASNEVLPMLPMLPKKTSEYVNTAPPAEGTTTPFGQKEMDAINAGHAVKVWSGVLETWLFWVRDEERKQKAIAKGIDPWRLWTLDELTAAQGMDPQDLRNLHGLKKAFNGTLNAGEKPQRWRDALEPMQPVVEVRS